MSRPASRIAERFKQLRAEPRAGFIPFITAGDSSAEVTRDLLAGLPGAGADLIELGMPFSDPMADGPAIQAGNLRALAGGITLETQLDLVREFRRKDDATPLLMMGYYNPIYRYGSDRFVKDAAGAGVDGLLIVDLPPEEDAELCEPCRAAGLDWIRLITPTTDARRLPKVLERASGFVYYVSITGITGTRSADVKPVAEALEAIRRHTDLPIAVGFGIREPEQARAIADFADAVVVGSALVDGIGEAAAAGGSTGDICAATLERTRRLSEGMRKL